MIVRAATGERFRLGKDTVIQTSPSLDYSAKRKDFRGNLKRGRYVKHLLHSKAPGIFIQMAGEVRIGTTQRGKKFIQIGCMRFVGESRRKLIAWAKGYKG